MREGLYTIDYFTAEKDQGQGGYGPSIILAGDVARAIMKHKRNEAYPLPQMLLDKLKGSVVEPQMARISYHEDTWLMTGMHVGSNCACFSMGGGTLSSLDNVKAIRYFGHNIDSVHHAAAILGVWTTWFNNVITLTEFEQPFAM